ncbi:hypothetical protein PInf_026111 [Phytophthora infestans]|nr:hypothetical protein PInf_026111 [Phytophthora infestans]
MERFAAFEAKKIEMRQQLEEAKAKQRKVASAPPSPSKTERLSTLSASGIASGKSNGNNRISGLSSYISNPLRSSGGSKTTGAGDDKESHKRYQRVDVLQAHHSFSEDLEKMEDQLEDLADLFVRGKIDEKEHSCIRAQIIRKWCKGMNSPQSAMVRVQCVKHTYCERSGGDGCTNSAPGLLEGPVRNSFTGEAEGAHRGRKGSISLYGRMKKAQKTQSEQERTLLKNTMLREGLLVKLHDLIKTARPPQSLLQPHVPPKEPVFDVSKGTEVLHVLLQLRDVGILVVENILRWHELRVRLAPMAPLLPFRFENYNYCVKMLSDLNFLSTIKSLGTVLGVNPSTMKQNPFMMPAPIPERDFKGLRDKPWRSLRLFTTSPPKTLRELMGSAHQNGCQEEDYGRGDNNRIMILRACWKGEEFAANAADFEALGALDAPPHHMVTLVAASVLILLSPADQLPKDLSWPSCQKMLRRGECLIQRVQVFDVAEVPAFKWKALVPFLQNEHFQPKFLSQFSCAASSMCAWIFSVLRAAQQQDYAQRSQQEEEAIEETEERRLMIKIYEPMSSVESQMSVDTEDLRQDFGESIGGVPEWTIPNSRNGGKRKQESALDLLLQDSESDHGQEERPEVVDESAAEDAPQSLEPETTLELDELDASVLKIQCAARQQQARGKVNRARAQKEQMEASALRIQCAARQKQACRKVDRVRAEKTMIEAVPEGEELQADSEEFATDEVEQQLENVVVPESRPGTVMSYASDQFEDDFEAA